ncbi:MAG: hypothetical protein ACLTG4_08245 [Oscillospiraceae bacterium]
MRAQARRRGEVRLDPPPETQQESCGFSNLKVDMFADEVFVISPKAMSSICPPATPIDFAYSIHSAIGNSMVGDGQRPHREL